MSNLVSLGQLSVFPSYFSPMLWSSWSFKTVFKTVSCSCVCMRVHVSGSFIFSGAAEARTRAEAAAGRALEACGRVCDRAHPDS